MSLGRSTARIWAENVNCQVGRSFAAGVSEWNRIEWHCWGCASGQQHKMFLYLKFSKLRASRSTKFWCCVNFWANFRYTFIVRKWQATVLEQVTWLHPVMCHKSEQQMSANSRNLPIKPPRTKFVLIKCDSRGSWSLALQESPIKLTLREGRQVDRTVGR